MGLSDSVECRSSSRCKSILIVEDEPSIRENIKTLLELEGYPVYTANDGEEGLRILRQMPRPCLVLLDLLMPIMNGMEFMEAKSQEDAIAAIPVCIVSGVDEKPNPSHESAFIKKPITSEAMQAVLHEIGVV